MLQFTLAFHRLPTIGTRPLLSAETAGLEQTETVFMFIGGQRWQNLHNTEAGSSLILRGKVCSEEMEGKIKGICGDNMGRSGKKAKVRK